ncbi:MAG: hypothetical protein ACRYFB_04240 [Janthinobacterium lividum]
MKKIYLLLAVLVIVSCNNGKQQTKIITDTVTIIKKDTISQFEPGNQKRSSDAPQGHTKQSLAGEWKEHWGIGVETNVNASDLYKIQLANDGKMNITCTNKKKYKIDQVLFDGKELSFRKQNKSYPLGKFYVYYKLKMHEDFNWMEGPITNNKKQKDFVKWERIKPKS